MPIEVRHDLPAGIAALAGLMGGAGRAAVSETEARRIAGRQIAAQEAQAARQTQQLQAQRAAQMRQIEAQADRQKEAADTAYQRTALAAGLQGKIQEQQFDNQMEKMQEAARLQASQWEYQYTTQQRQEIAKLNEIDQLVETDPKYADIRDQWRVMSLQQRAGIRPGALPADPNKTVYPEGVGPGILTREPDGSTTTIDKDGNKKLILRPDQTMEYMERQEEIKQAQAKRDKEEKFMDKVAAERAKIAGTLIEVEGVDESGEKTLHKQYPTPAQVWARLQVAYPPPWPGREAEGLGMERGPTDAQLEEARNLLREMRAKQDRGEGLFPDEILAVQEAGRLLRGSVTGGSP